MRTERCPQRTCSRKRLPPHARTRALAHAHYCASVPTRLSGFDEAVRRRERATCANEWLDAQYEIDMRMGSGEEQLCERDEEFFSQLQQRKETYEKLQAEGDEYGLMFHLRSELMRRQAGGAGYNRDGSTWLRRHGKARDRIHAYQAAVCNALRYIASGTSPIP